VNKDVLLEIRILIEFLGAQVTTEGPQSRMDQAMGGQGRRSPKALAALIALYDAKKTVDGSKLLTCPIPLAGNRICSGRGHVRVI
jgi:hypothetical protein